MLGITWAWLSGKNFGEVEALSPAALYFVFTQGLSSLSFILREICLKAQLPGGGTK